ncbi:putative site-specific recombinase [Bifidobacterium magnum]|uniref:Putative site-specific recombinase n=1 Tax=Bifidobacterium magnum TaxID=1692 RepID=A0A087B681_9BIFI|nr:putative site-specific recombinase [Bifidobacterium magnum]
MVFSSRIRSLSCQVAGCDRPAVARGMCKSHYNRWQYSGSAVPKRRERLCSCCGNAFEVKRSSQQFCSDVCRLRYFRRRKREPWLAEHPHTPLHELPVEPVAEATSVPAEVFSERDVWKASGGICHVCGEPASRDVYSRDVGAPSWLVPPKLGGSRTLSNSVIVHYRCLGRQG